MSHILSLITNPARPVLETAHITTARAHLPEAAAAVWLAEGVAAEIPFTVEKTLIILEKIRAALADQPIDINIIPAANRRKRLLIADMDSTMIGQECIDELAATLGLKEQVSEITERAMRGEIAFEPALRERVALLKNLPVSVVDEVLRDRITFTPGGDLLVRTIRSQGAYAALVSGGFTLFTGPVSAALGFDEHRSNILETDDGRLTGAVREPILGREAKRQRLLELRAELKLTPEETLAVGDGANDLDMLGEAGLGVAYHAKPAVAAAAHARIDHGDLTALLYLQGYRT